VPGALINFSIKIVSSLSLPLQSVWFFSKLELNMQMDLLVADANRAGPSSHEGTSEELTASKYWNCCASMLVTAELLWILQLDWWEQRSS